MTVFHNSFSHKRAFRRILCLPRPLPDPQLEWHLRLYDQYTKLKRWLEKHTDTPLLSNEDLESINVVRGAEINIDEVNPIDVEPRFFLPGSSIWAEQCAQMFDKKDEDGWPGLEPESEWDVYDGKRLADLRSVYPFQDAVLRAIEWWSYSPYFIRREVERVGGSYWFSHL